MAETETTASTEEELQVVYQSTRNINAFLSIKKDGSTKSVATFYGTIDSSGIPSISQSVNDSQWVGAHMADFQKAYMDFAVKLFTEAAKK